MRKFKECFCLRATLFIIVLYVFVFWSILFEHQQFSGYSSGNFFNYYVLWDFFENFFEIFFGNSLKISSEITWKFHLKLLAHCSGSSFGNYFGNPFLATSSGISLESSGKSFSYSIENFLINLSRTIFEESFKNFFKNSCTNYMKMYGATLLEHFFCILRIDFTNFSKLLSQFLHYVVWQC